MGTRDPEQPPLWIATSDLPVSPGHPFYTRLNALLDADDFDAFVEEACRTFYAPVLGRPSLAPGRYFRLLLVGYFEGIDSERGIAWRAADSLAVRSFLRLGLEQAAPDHSTISRTRRLIDVETHRAVLPRRISFRERKRTFKACGQRSGPPTIARSPIKRGSIRCSPGSSSRLASGPT